MLMDLWVMCSTAARAPPPPLSAHVLDSSKTKRPLPAPQTRMLKVTWGRERPRVDFDGERSVNSVLVLQTSS